MHWSYNGDYPSPNLSIVTMSASRPRLSHLALLPLALSLLIAMVSASEVGAQSEAWAPRRMWQFAALALVGSLLLSIDGTEHALHARPTVTTGDLLALISSALATFYILRCEPDSARLGAGPLSMLKNGSIAVLTYIVFSAAAGPKFAASGIEGLTSISPAVLVANLAAAVGGVALLTRLSGLDFVPGTETAPIILFAPLCARLGVRILMSGNGLGLPGKIGAVAIVGASLERAVFAARLVMKAKTS